MGLVEIEKEIVLLYYIFLPGFLSCEKVLLFSSLGGYIIAHNTKLRIRAWLFNLCKIKLCVFKAHEYIYMLGSYRNL